MSECFHSFKYVIDRKYICFIVYADSCGGSFCTIYWLHLFSQPATLLKKSLWHRCFPVNFAKFLRTPFLQNTSGWLLLQLISLRCPQKFIIIQVFLCEYNFLKNHPQRRVQFRKSFTKKSKNRQRELESAFLEHLEVQILKIFPLGAMVAPSWVRYIYQSTQKNYGYVTVFLTHRENNFCRLCFTLLNASVEISNNIFFKS